MYDGEGFQALLTSGLFLKVRSCHRYINFLLL